MEPRQRRAPTSRLSVGRGKAPRGGQPHARAAPAGAGARRARARHARRDRAPQDQARARITRPRRRRHRARTYHPVARVLRQELRDRAMQGALCPSMEQGRSHSLDARCRRARTLPLDRRLRARLPTPDVQIRRRQTAPRRQARRHTRQILHREARAARQHDAHGRYGLLSCGVDRRDHGRYAPDPPRGRARLARLRGAHQLTGSSRVCPR